jgi:membrane protease YdiL (CAAX protease family)
MLNLGPVSRRWRYVVLVGEVAGPAKALDALSHLESQFMEEGIHLNRSQKAVEHALSQLYRDYLVGDFSAASVTNQERNLLRTRLGWYGELALTPAEGPDEEARQAIVREARRTTIVFLGSLGFFACLTLAGFMGLTLLLAFLIAGRLQGGVQPGPGPGGLYAETFAVWLGLFLALNLGVGLIATQGIRLLLGGTASLLSLGALGWPVIRGIPWRQVRDEIGLTAGRRGVFELVLGLACYCMTLPLLAVGLVITLALVKLTVHFTAGADSASSFDAGAVPTHPIILYVANADWWYRLQVLFVASVTAPIVEETMFRGVLYRHLRCASARWGKLVSVILSAFLTSFLFAIVHPQGLLAVPALMALAIGLSLAREWRGSLLAGMAMHAVNNGLVLGLLILALS